eukprot:c15447_g2_i1.p1 GENE.c15447_g2_i1~~c15447_g2_i1.p1  ORF type:complete len:350 (+),score=106.41 c15447_g2_i1:31-1080(+)
MTISTEKKEVTVFGPGQAVRGPLEDFIWTLNDEPHQSRRKAILAKHPEVRKLMGIEPKTKYYAAFLVVAQISLAIYLRNDTFSLKFWILTYVFGATLAQSLFLAVHEISHFLAFKTMWHNRVFNFFVNLPIGIPYSAAFKVYHVEHHRYQGVDGVDTDLPTKIEGLLFTNVLTKLVFCTFQILFYALRPCIVRKQIISTWHILNIITQLTFNTLLVYFFGWGPIIYFIISDFLAGSLHPCGGHFIAEHFVFVGDYETYSYYGWLNNLCFNVGYHNEHHDFPNIAWTKLPALRKLAPEFYDNLPQHKSWMLVIWKFVTDPNVSAKNRVKRKDIANLARNPCGDIPVTKDD